MNLIIPLKKTQICLNFEWLLVVLRKLFQMLDSKGRGVIHNPKVVEVNGPQQAGPARKLGSLARVHRAHFGPGPPAQVTRHGQGSTAPLQGTARLARSVRFIDPAPGRPDCSRTPLGFIGPAPGVGPLQAAHPGTPGPSTGPPRAMTSIPELLYPRVCQDILCHCVAPGSSCLINGTRLMSTPSAFSTGFIGPLKRASPGGGKYAG